MIHLPRLAPLTLRALGAAGAVASAALTLALAACSDPSAPVAPIGHLSLAKAPSGPSVNSASPSYAHRDTTLNVRVLGSGFTSGAVAEWSLGGVPNSAKIKTNSTQFVSSSELLANITVSADADLALWDITVTLIGGKKGVGTEKFEVTTATILGSGTIGGDMWVQAANDQLSVVGYAAGAFVYDAISSTLVSLGGGQAWGIDPSGTIALGRDGGFLPVAWVRDIAGTWTPEPLPRDGISGGIANRTALASDGSLIASGWIIVPVSRRDEIRHPVLWRRANGTWAAPLKYAIPGIDASGWDVSANERIAGRTTFADKSVRGVVWDSPTAFTVLDGLALAINDAGTVVVGYRGGAATYWYRHGVTGLWSATGTALPVVGSCAAGSRAYDVNDAGVIVGASCGPNGKAVASVWKLDLSGPAPTIVQGPTRLGGLGMIGAGAELSNAVSVTSVPPYAAAGYVAASPNLLVSWQLP